MATRVGKSATSKQAAGAVGRRGSNRSDSAWTSSASSMRSMPPSGQLALSGNAPASAYLAASSGGPSKAHQSGAAQNPSVQVAQIGSAHHGQGPAIVAAKAQAIPRASDRTQQRQDAVGRETTDNDDDCVDCDDDECSCSLTNDDCLTPDSLGSPLDQALVAVQQQRAPAFHTAAGPYGHQAPPHRLHFHHHHHQHQQQQQRRPAAGPPLYAVAARQQLNECALSGRCLVGAPPQSAPAGLQAHSGFHLPAPASPKQVATAAGSAAVLHRPLLPHSSMPPISLTDSHSGGLQQAPQTQPQAAPPPLVRHSTYTASSDTITDRTLALGNVISPTSGAQAPPSPPGAANQPFGRHEQRAFQTLQHQRHGVSFRRAATTPESGASEWRARKAASGQQQQQKQQVIFGGARQQQQHKSGGQHAAKRRHEASANKLNFISNGGGNNVQTHQPASLANLSPNSHQPASSSAGALPNRQGSCATGGGGGELGGAIGASAAAGFVGSGAALGTNVASLTSAATAAYFPSASIPLMPINNNNNNSCHRATSAFSAAAGSRGNLFTSVSPFEAVAFCPTAPIITSHRTNSPWMRLSSIILMPIGLVIILFIVVSPLLHYLM